MKITRENWKGKYKVVLRRNNGTIISNKKWSRNFTLTDGAKIAKKNKTLSETKTRVQLTNVVEVVDTGKGARKPKVSYQAFVKIKIGKQVITARSQQHEASFPKREAKAEAMDSALERLAQSQGMDYDAEIGKELLSNTRNARVSEGIVYYAKT